MTGIRVLIADDHAAIRSGLRLILGNADGIDVVGEAADGDIATTQAAALRPDVVVMDVRMPGLDGIAATERITAAGTARVLILTTFEIDENVFRALRACAAGFLLKSASTDSLVDAVRTVAAGDAVLAPQVTRTLIEAFAASSAPPTQAPTGFDTLTERERDVLSCLGDGLSNAQIGARLFIGETTVKTHVSRVLTKLNVASRVQAAIVAQGLGG